MATAMYRTWANAGSPNDGLIRPLRALRNRLRSYGYTVYDIGNDAHLTHNPPEDHTPFSATGWPDPSPRWWLHAIDVMPPKPGSGLPSLQRLGAQLVADRHAGHPGVAWLKYINWEPDRDNGGRCFKDSWQPTHVRRSSTDRGHIHASARSDMTFYSAADSYDPVARIRTPTSQGAPDMDPRVETWLTQWIGDQHGTNGRGLVMPTIRMDDLHGKADRLLSLAAADEARDQAVLAAVQALAAGGGVDAAPIVAAIQQVRADTLNAVAVLQAENAALRDELARTREAAEANLSEAERDALDSSL